MHSRGQTQIGKLMAAASHRTSQGFVDIALRRFDHYQDRIALGGAVGCVRSRHRTLLHRHHHRAQGRPWRTAGSAGRARCGAGSQPRLECLSHRQAAARQRWREPVSSRTADPVERLLRRGAAKRSRVFGLDLRERSRALPRNEVSSPKSTAGESAATLSERCGPTNRQASPSRTLRTLPWRRTRPPRALIRSPIPETIRVTSQADF